MSDTPRIHPAPAGADPAPDPARLAAVAARVREEYARYLEKRDALRKDNGRLRRSLIHRQLAS